MTDVFKRHPRPWRVNRNSSSVTCKDGYVMHFTDDQLSFWRLIVAAVNAYEPKPKRKLTMEIEVETASETRARQKHTAALIARLDKISGAKPKRNKKTVRE